LNIDLQGSGITLAVLDSQLLSHLLKLSIKLKRIQFIQKGLSINTDFTQFDFNNGLVTAVQEITNNKTSRRSLMLHTIPYPDKMLYLPFVQWNKVYSSNNNGKPKLDEGKYM
jgi:hypothetical protein